MRNCVSVNELCLPCLGLLLLGLTGVGCTPQDRGRSPCRCPPPRAAPGATATAPRAASSAPRPHSDLDRCVSMAWAKLKAIGRTPGDFRLVSVVNLYRLRSALWRVTFKPKRLIPADPTQAAISAGGEVFVNVDLEAGTTEVRYGE